MKQFIYGLIDPETNLIRYVGKTNNLKSRFNKHLSECNKKGFWTPKNKWIRSLKERGLSPIMSIIEETTTEYVNNLEMEYIKKYPNLTNSTEGGDGGWTGNKHSVESIKKMKHSHYKKTILQFDLNNNFIEAYNSLAEAGILTKLDYRTILKCCKNILTSYEGYYFRFSDNFYTCIDAITVANEEEIHKICLINNTYEEPNFSKQKIINDALKKQKEKIKKVLPKYIEYDLEGNILNIHNTLSEAIKSSGCHGQLILDCCKDKKYYTVNNRTFRYEGDIFDYYPYNKNVQASSRKISKYTLDGIFVENYDSIKRAATNNGVIAANISKCCNKKMNMKGSPIIVGGFTYRYAEDNF